MDSVWARTVIKWGKKKEREKVNCDFVADVSETYLQRDKIADMIYLEAKITLSLSLSLS